jgi:hypothetical protein
VLLGYGVPSVTGELFAYGRKVMAPEYELDMLYIGEGMNASICGFAARGWGALVPRQRQDGSDERSGRHAAAAHARPLAGPAASEATQRC